MSTKTVLWAIVVVIAWAGVAVLTPERIGERAWFAFKIPIVLFLIVSWFGFVLAVIAQAIAPKPAAALETSEVDLSNALSPDETLIASARLGTKLTVLGLVLTCMALVVWDGFVRTPPQWFGTGIWAAAAGALAGYLYNLIQRRVVLAPTSISWQHSGRSIHRKYGDVIDFAVLSGNGIQIVFGDGQKVAVTSDMADLKTILATVTVRRRS